MQGHALYLYKLSCKYSDGTQQQAPHYWSVPRLSLSYSRSRNHSTPYGTSTHSPIWPEIVIFQDMSCQVFKIQCQGTSMVYRFGTCHDKSDHRCGLGFQFHQHLTLLRHIVLNVMKANVANACLNLHGLLQDAAFLAHYLTC